MLPHRATLALRSISIVLSVLALWLGPAHASGQSFFFSTGAPDGRLGGASRQESPAGIEIEAADDFLLNSETLIQTASFTGLLPTGSTTANISDVGVEIYRVFPKDSDTNRIPNVPTRANSPSDVAFMSRDLVSNELTMTASTVGAFSAANSVLNGIHPFPGQTTGGEGPVSGSEVQLTVTFNTPLDLPADHYFFIPQVRLSNNANFFWLSSPRPIGSDGTPFSPDLQAWIRNANLDPDWLRIGTDIVGGTTPPTFNMSFSLNGTVIPEPAALSLLAGMVALSMRRRRRP
jgi:hypothetical protein